MSDLFKTPDLPQEVTTTTSYETKLCAICNVSEKKPSSLFCDSCEYSVNNHGKKKKVPVRREIAWCKVFGCKSEATQNSLCHLHAASFKPVAPVVPVAKPEPEPEPKLKDILYTNCVRCEKPLRGDNHFVGFCSEHQEREKVPKRKCNHPSGCGRMPRDPRHLFCFEHAKDNRKKHAENCRRRRTKSFLLDIDEVEADFQKRNEREGLFTVEEC